MPDKERNLSFPELLAYLQMMTNMGYMKPSEMMMNLQGLGANMPVRMNQTDTYVTSRKG